LSRRGLPRPFARGHKAVAGAQARSSTVVRRAPRSGRCAAPKAASGRKRSAQPETAARGAMRLLARRGPPGRGRSAGTSGARWTMKARSWRRWSRRSGTRLRR
jgi:hypothetical protein